MPPKPAPLRAAAAVMAAALLSGGAASLFSESITLTTSYPSPAGIYKRLVTTGETVLARDEGNVRVGSGGMLELGGRAADPPAESSRNGMLYYNTALNRVRVFQAGAWKNLGGAPLNWGSWQTANLGTVYRSDNGAFVMFTCSSDGGGIDNVDIFAYSDANPNPTTMIGRSGIWDNGFQFLFVAVRPGDYWKVTARVHADGCTSSRILKYAEFE